MSKRLPTSLRKRISVSSLRTTLDKDEDEDEDTAIEVVTTATSDETGPLPKRDHSLEEWREEHKRLATYFAQTSITSVPYFIPISDDPPRNVPDSCVNPMYVRSNTVQPLFYYPILFNNVSVHAQPAASKRIFLLVDRMRVVGVRDTYTCFVQLALFDVVHNSLEHSFTFKSVDLFPHWTQSGYNIRSSFTRGTIIMEHNETTDSQCVRFVMRTCGDQLSVRLTVTFTKHFPPFDTTYFGTFPTTAWHGTPDWAETVSFARQLHDMSFPTLLPASHELQQPPSPEQSSLYAPATLPSFDTPFTDQ